MDRTGETIVCRCEDITLEQLRDWIGQGYRTLDELRRIARLGMGQCQGKNCRLLALFELAAATGSEPGELELNTWRPPLRPVSISALAQAADRGDDR